MSEATKVKLPRVSASKLKLYQSCPTSYKFRYIEGNAGEANIWALVGSAAHKAIELYYAEGVPILATFTERVTRAVSSETEGVENFIPLLRDIQTGLEGFVPEDYKPIALEKYFRLPYPNEEHPICTIEGYMDLVEENSIVDFKTGRETPSKRAMEADLQFIIYSWAFSQLYGKSPERIIYHRLRNNKKIIGTSFNQEQLDTLIKTFLADPMEYELQPCENCPFYCGVKRHATNALHDGRLP